MEDFCRPWLEFGGLEAFGVSQGDSPERILERPEELTMRGVRSDATSGVSGLHSNAPLYQTDDPAKQLWAMQHAVEHERCCC